MSTVNGETGAAKELLELKHELARTRELLEEKTREAATNSTELCEALEYQTATSEVLSVISRSPTEVHPVLHTIAATASRLCHADHSTIFRIRDGLCHLEASEATPDFVGYLTRNPIRLDGHTLSARAARSCKVLHVPDTTLGGDFDPTIVQRSGAKTLLSVPLLRDGGSMGVITIGRRDVLPFTAREIDLVTTFANEAVIAIENARLFEEEQTRTRELQESLEYQTATSEILNIISRSPTDVQPVFDIIAHNTVRLCAAAYAMVFRFDGRLMHLAAHHNVSPDGLKALESQWPMRPDPRSLPARAVVERRTVHLHDVLEEVDNPYLPTSRVLGIRTMLIVPIMRGGEPIGAVAAYRQKVEPFSERQIALVATFASQAVIAIENVRLFETEQQRTRELRESLEYQTATGELLNIISRSPTDVQPVFDTIVASAARLCGAIRSNVQLYDGSQLHVAATHNFGPDGLKQFGALYPMSPDRSQLAGRAILAKATVHVRDVQADPNYSQDMAKAGGLRACLSVPMLRDDKPYGVITVSRSEPVAFTERQVNLLKTFADQAIIAIENTRLFEAEQQRSTELREALEHQTATNGVLRVISGSAADLKPVLQAVIETATRLCGADRGHIFRYDGEYLEYAEAYGASPAFLEQLKGRRFRPGTSSATRRAALERRTVHIKDVVEDPDYDDKGLVDAQPYRTVLAVPIQRSNELLGVIAIPKTYVQPFTPRQIKLVETFADQVVIAINNARLFEAEQERTEELRESLEYQTATSEVLNVISRSPTDADPVFDIIGERAARLCDAEISVVSMLEGNLISAVSVHGTSPAGMDALQRAFPMARSAETVTARSIRTGTVVHVADVLVDPLYEQKQAARTGGYRCSLGVPMFREGNVFGAIFVAKTRPELFTESQVKLLQTFADQAVIAIENARLFEEVQDRTKALAQSVEELRALGEVGRTVSSTLDLAKVLQTVLEHACRMTSAGSGTIYVYDAGSGEFRLEAGHNMSAEHTSRVRAQPMRIGDPVIGECAENRSAVQIEDVAEEDPERSPLFDVLLRSGVRAILAVPLLHRDKIIGALVVRRMYPGAFSPEAVRLLEALGAQSAIAINNARLFAEVEETGRALAIASQHKSQFLANMSHELRTPLNAILGYTELIQDGLYGEPNPKVTEVLSRVQSNGKHLLGLINDVLDLSKIEAGELTLAHDAYSMSDAIQTVISATEALAVEKALRLDANVPTELPVALGDERRLVQVLLNLVGNAIKFTDTGKVKISVRAKDGRFVIEVADTGPGIPEAEIARIFDEFHQVDSSATKRKGGTGLGLAISKRIVELHGGQLSVESEVGKGSIFRVDLPVRFETIRY